MMSSNEPIFGYTIPLSIFFSSSQLKDGEYRRICDVMKQMAFLLDTMDAAKYPKEYILAAAYMDMVEERVLQSIKKEISSFVGDSR